VILRSRAVAALQAVRATYWFFPALLTLAAILLSLLLTAFDRTIAEVPVWLGWAYGGGADGARALLSAVAGSMITVVSVTFSVMVVALTVSSQHFGPRLLRSFMRDRPAQLVLGTFTGTFAYCLMVLRTVQGDGGDLYERFIPHLAVTGAVVLALISVGALIYYVHHIALSMQVTEITRRIGHELEHAIERLYPDPIGSPAESRANYSSSVPADAAQVRASTTGYVQNVDENALFGMASDCRVTIWLHARPGDFVVKGEVIGALSPATRDRREAADAVAEAYVIGSERSLQKDAGFAVQQLVEIALRALSPGVNEPFTAIAAIDWLAGPFSSLAERGIPSATRTDDSGRVRVVTAPRTFAGLLHEGFEPIALHGGRNPEVAGRLLDSLARLAVVARRTEDRQAIADVSRIVWTTAARELLDELHRSRLADQYARVQRTLEVPPRAPDSTFAAHVPPDANAPDTILL
jgi:uncharacterized membrane protein